jgi:two-component system phosphate regulon sensor histidine kinase PhoR
MSVALLGVTAMQFYFLRQSYQMQSELFDRSVNEALNSVATKVAKQDAMNFLNTRAQRTNNGFHIKEHTIHIESNSDSTPVVKPDNIKKITVVKAKSSPRQKKLAMWRDSLKRMIMHKKMEDELAGINQEGSFDFKIRIEEFTDEFGDVHGRLIPMVVRKEARVLKKNQKINKYDTLNYVYLDPQFGRQIISVPQINPLWKQQQYRIKKERELQQVKRMLEQDSLQNLPEKVNNKKITVIENLAEEYRKSDEPLTKRVNRFWIDSLLRFELHNKGIYLPFSYEVLTAFGDSLIFSNALNMS